MDACMRCCFRGQALSRLPPFPFPYSFSPLNQSALLSWAFFFACAKPTHKGFCIAASRMEKALGQAPRQQSLSFFWENSLSLFSCSPLYLPRYPPRPLPLLRRLQLTLLHGPNRPSLSFAQHLSPSTVSGGTCEYSDWERPMLADTDVATAMTEWSIRDRDVLLTSRVATICKGAYKVVLNPLFRKLILKVQFLKKKSN
jgi:hypothetical protein